MYIICIYIYIYILEPVVASTTYSSTSLFSVGLANCDPVPSLFGQRPSNAAAGATVKCKGYPDVMDLEELLNHRDIWI